jgi:acid phosphatase family membrane protein YuiD
MNAESLDLQYFVLPFLTWAIVGSMKFAVNSIRIKQLAWSQIGYGGMPSNHSAIVSSIVTLIWLKEGLSSSAFGVAITIAFIVIMDAGSLRYQVGLHARALNKITLKISENINQTPYRETMGHKKSEILAGILVGAVSGLVVYNFV